MDAQSQEGYYLCSGWECPQRRLRGCGSHAGTLTRECSGSAAVPAPEGARGILETVPPPGPGCMRAEGSLPGGSFLSPESGWPADQALAQCVKHAVGNRRPVRLKSCKCSPRAATISDQAGRGENCPVVGRPTMRPQPHGCSPSLSGQRADACTLVTGPAPSCAASFHTLSALLAFPSPRV